MVAVSPQNPGFATAAFVVVTVDGRGAGFPDDFVGAGTAEVGVSSAGVLTAGAGCATLTADGGAAGPGAHPAVAKAISTTTPRRRPLLSMANSFGRPTEPGQRDDSRS